MTLDIKKLLTHILGPDFRYPVGSYYETSIRPNQELIDGTTETGTLFTDYFNPSQAWGGTWELEIEGQVHISAGTNYAVSGALTNTTDGGEAIHSLTEAEMPRHTHGIRLEYGAQASPSYPPGGSYAQVTNNTSYGYYNNNTMIQPIGGSQPHNNMQPHINVYRWHRTA